jgi:hypothetical protein
VFPPVDETGMGNETLMAFGPSPIVDDDDRDAVEERKSTEPFSFPKVRQARLANRTAVAKTMISEVNKALEFQFYDEILTFI